MNYGQIRTAIVNNGRFDTSQDTVMKDWVTSAYTWVWQGARWQFKRVTGASLSIVSGTEAPTLPTDFGDKLEIWDNNGDQLVFMDPTEFEDRYRADKISATTGQPEAFKIVNRALILGPTPNITATFRINYDKKAHAYQSDGTTVVLGGMSADTDIPAWGAEHHMLLVYRALEIGYGLESDNSAVMASELAQDALDAMILDLALTDPPVQQYGRVEW